MATTRKTTTHRKDPKRVAAGKKAARTRKRTNPKGTRRTTRRTTRRKKTGLSELFNPKMAQAQFKTTAVGGLGGAGAALIYSVTPNWQPWQRLAAGLGASFVTGVLGRMPDLSAGMAGGTTACALISSGTITMSEMSQHNYAKGIEQLPMVLNENGDELYLQEGEDLYLQEDDNMYLQEDDLGYSVYNYDFGQ